MLLIVSDFMSNALKVKHFCVVTSRSETNSKLWNKTLPAILFEREMLENLYFASERFYERFQAFGKFILYQINDLLRSAIALESREFL